MSGLRPATSARATGSTSSSTAPHHARASCACATRFGKLLAKSRQSIAYTISQSELIEAAETY